MKKKTNRFSNYTAGYAETQLQKLRNLRHRQTDARLAALERFNDYIERQRVGGVK